MVLKISTLWPPLRCKEVCPFSARNRRLWESTDDLRKCLDAKHCIRKPFEYVSLLSDLNISALTFVFFSLFLPGISRPSGCNAIRVVVLFM